MDKITLTLPYPISANRYWRTYMPTGFKAPVTTVSPEAKSYKRSVAWIAKSSGLQSPIKGKVRIEMRIYPRRPENWLKRKKADPDTWDMSVRCIDIDNARKVVYDALNGIAYEDDKMIWDDSATRMMPDGESRIEITVSKI